MTNQDHDSASVNFDKVCSGVLADRSMNIEYSLPLSRSANFNVARYPVLTAFERRVASMLPLKTHETLCSLPLSADEHDRLVKEAAHAVFDGACVTCSPTGATLCVRYPRAGYDTTQGTYSDLLVTGFSVAAVGEIGEGIRHAPDGPEANNHLDTVTMQAESYLARRDSQDMNLFKQFEMRVHAAMNTPKRDLTLSVQSGIGYETPNHLTYGITRATAVYLLGKFTLSAVYETIYFMHALVTRLAGVEPERYDLKEHTYSYMDAGDETLHLCVCLARDSWEAVRKHACDLGFDDIEGIEAELQHAWTRITTPILSPEHQDNDPCSCSLSYSINRQMPWVTYAHALRLEIQLVVAEHETTDHVIASFTPERASTPA